MSFPNDHSMNIIRLDTGEERNTMLNWHLYPADEHNTVPPEPKFIYEDTPGVDGNLDVSENTSDRILFNNRKGEWEFYVANRPLHQPNIDETQTWADIQSDISNFLHGQKCKVIFADDPNYYYIGRLSVTDFEPNKSYQHVTIEYEFEPYKYEHEAYDSGTLSVSGTSSVTAAGSPMPAIPTITITSSKFAFHQHNELTRGEAVYMLYNLLGNGGIDVTITESKFLDVSEDDFYYDAVLWAEQYGVTAGISDKIFGGDNICTRAQFIQMLMVASWYPDWPPANIKKGNIPFTDVKINSYYYFAVKQAYYEGLIAGDGNGHFMPNEPMTREHACAIIFKRDPYGDGSGVGDVIIDLEGETTIAPWYYVAVVKLYNEGIISGYADGTYKPANYITRGQFVTMLYAADGKPSVSSVSHPFTDVTSDMYCNDAVKYCYTKGWISGTSETTFNPERAMLRKEMLQVLFQYGNAKAITNSRLDYFDPDGEEDNDDAAASGYEVATDVPVESYYFYAVAWGVMNGITTLSVGNMFYPDQKATRAMAAQMLYKLLKILNGWVDDTAATINVTDTETITHTETHSDDILATDAHWRQGYYNSNTNSTVNETTHLRTVFMGSQRSTLGDVTHVLLKVPTNLLWRIHWFSYVDNSTQTLLSETSWAYGQGDTEISNVFPSQATHFMVSVMFRDGIQATTSTENVSLSWEVGGIGTLGEDISGSIVNDSLKSNMIDVTDADSLNAKWPVTDSDWQYMVYWYSGSTRSRANFIEATSWQSGTGTIYRTHTKPTGATHACFLVTDGTGAQMFTSQAQNFEAQVHKTVMVAQNIEISDADDVEIYRSATTTTTTTETVYGVSDINKYTVNYADAIKYCYKNDLIDDMIERAPMDVTLENSKGTKTVTVPSGEDLVPELLVVDGENEFTVEGTGTYRIQFKRGSL